MSSSPKTSATTSPRYRATRLLALAKEKKKDETSDTAKWAHALLEDAVWERASDVHFDPDDGRTLIRFRVDGVMVPAARLEHEDGDRLVRYFRTAADMEPGAVTLPDDGRMHYELEKKWLDIRVVVAPCLDGAKMVLRILVADETRLRFHELGLSEEDHDEISTWLRDINGLFLVCGPTGSGKTSTLYALLLELHRMKRSVITIEDPVEYHLDGAAQIQVNEARGLTYAQGMKAIMRLDPDYIHLGEIRDHESAEAALEAAGAGRVLLSTIHTRDAAGAVTSLRNFHINDHDIATALSFVIAQRLVRRLCRHCAKEGAPTDPERRWLDSLDIPAPKTSWHAKGCSQCGHTGYRGRIGVFETWPMREDTYQLILDHADEAAIRSHLRNSGLHSLHQDGVRKAAAGVTSLSDLISMGGLTFFSKRV